MTFKERLSRWYHHKTLWRTVIGTLGKFAIETLFWATVATLVFSVGKLLPWNLVSDIPFLSRTFIMMTAGFSVTFTFGAWCISTLPADQID